ncbi:MAG: sensor histidine kinase [Terrimesophilobacter sp.]
MTDSLHTARANPLTPIFLGLRICLHTMITLLTGFVIVRAITSVQPRASWIIAFGLVFLVSYIAGAFLARTGVGRVAQLGWLLALSTLALALAAWSPDAAFLVFPLFFLQLHLLSTRWGITAVLLTTAVTVVTFALHNGWNTGSVVGPLVGAAVAIAIGMGYRALYREVQERKRLIDDLLATREELALRERDAGVMQERQRLAREIHDTVAQGLSSIQMLLHAVERDGLGETSLEHVRLARETAGANLAEARRFIRELTPPALIEHSLPGALIRLAESTCRDDIAVSFHLSGEATKLPMPLETGLLRIAQAALANVIQHANASRAEVTLTYLDDWVGLDVVDNGTGFDPKQVTAVPAVHRTSFGLVAMRQRVEQLGGTLTVESHGAGTAIAAAFEIPGGQS